VGVGMGKFVGAHAFGQVPLKQYHLTV